MRVAILDAARRLADQNGIDSLTLSAVAAEVGIARGTVYGYLSGKQDLLSQLRGDAPADQTPAPPPDEPVTSHPAPVPAEDEAPEDAEPAPPIEEAVPARDDVKAAVPDTPARAEAPDGYGEMMRLQAAELDTLAKRIIVPKSMMKEGTDNAIARLEARVRMVEQSITAIESRLGCDAKQSIEQAGIAADGMHQLRKRMESSENRLQMALAELRLDVHNLTNATHGMVRPIAQSYAEPLGAALPAPADDKPTSAVPAVAPASASGQTSEQGYLASARRAAVHAAEQEDAKKTVGGRRIKWRWLLNVAILLTACFGALLYTQWNLATRGHAVAATMREVETRSAAIAPVRDPIEALAAAGNAKAQLILGDRLLNGAGVATDILRGASWLERAAENGQPVAQVSLGVLYQTGTGVVADMAKAVGWYETAANQGNVRAMANLGKIYAGGWAQGTDFKKAAQWLARAAKLGDVNSQFDLAVLLERGEGVPRNLTDAYKWYSVAASQGDHDAAARAAVIGAHLLPGYLQAAKQAVKRFTPDRIDRTVNNLPTPEALLGGRS